MVRLGCIADDFTGGTDVAAALRRSGLSVVLLFGAPDDERSDLDADAVVVALKTRTVAAGEAVGQALAALAWLRAHEAGRVYFKYCSTFDSTDEGNIGPVTDALLAALGESTTVICPASPEHGRTMYNAHLFVGDRLLNESPMRDHPLTPMTDPDISRVLQRQTDGVVGRLPLPVLCDGPEAVTAHLAALTAQGVRHVVADTVTDSDLRCLAAAVADHRLATGGAGLARALGAVIAERSGAAGRPRLLPAGPSVVLAGSCSAATLTQVAAAAAVMPAHRLDPATTSDPAELLANAATWLETHFGDGPVLMYSSAGPEEQARARAAMGPGTPAILEHALGALAVRARDLGARRIVVAGGETSGAVVQALGIGAVTVGHEADRGVPWCLTTDEPALALLLKSGNFGSEDLLVRATDGATR